MSIVSTVQQRVSLALQALYGISAEASAIPVNETKPDFEGDYTVVLFGFVKSLKLNPDTLGKALGDHLCAEYPGLFSSYNIIKGFLNLGISDAWWMEHMQSALKQQQYGWQPLHGKR